MKPQIYIKDAIGMTLKGVAVIENSADEEEKLVLSFTDGFCLFMARNRVNWVEIEEPSKPVDLLEFSAIAVTLGIATVQEIAQLIRERASAVFEAEGKV